MNLIICEANSAEMVTALMPPGCDIRVLARDGLAYSGAALQADLRRDYADVRMIVCMGAAAATALLPDLQGLSVAAMRNRDDLEWGSAPVLVTYAPAYVSRSGGPASREGREVAADLARAFVPSDAAGSPACELFGADRLSEFMQAFAAAPLLALDYEGSSLDPTIDGFRLAGVGLASDTRVGYLWLCDFEHRYATIDPAVADKLGRFLKHLDNQRRLLVFNLGYEVPLTKFMLQQDLRQVTDVMMECRSLDMHGGLKEISRRELSVFGWTREVEAWLDTMGALLHCLAPTARGPVKEWAEFERGGLVAVLESLDARAAKMTRRKQPDGTWLQQAAGYNNRTAKVRDAVMAARTAARAVYGERGDALLDAFVRDKADHHDWDANYTDLPLAIVSTYCGRDCHNTLRLHQRLAPRLASTEMTRAAGFYNDHAYLGAAMESNGVLWDDDTAQSVRDACSGVMMDALRGFLLSERARATLTVRLNPEDDWRPLGDQDVLDIQSTTDLATLKRFFNPDSTQATNTARLARCLVSPMVRVMMMLQALRTEHDATPALAAQRYPTLVRLMSAAADKSVAAVHRFGTMLQAALQAGKLSDTEQEFLHTYTGWTLTDSGADTVQTLADAFKSVLAADLDDRTTWPPELQLLFYYKLYKKASKVVSSFVDGAAGREAVRIVAPNGNGGFRRLARYGDRPLQPGELYLYEPAYNVCAKITRRWSSAYHGIPPMCDIKRAFVSRFADGLVLKCDFSQHELRIIAAVSGDEALKAAFLSGKDMHRYAASLIFAVAEAEVTGNQRAVAKSAMFGIVYLKTVESFARELLDGDMEQAQRIFDTLRSLYPRLHEWRDGQVASVHHACAVSPSNIVRLPIKTLWGDTIWHEFDRSDSMAVIEAERYAVNWQIQSTGSNLAGLAAAKTEGYLRTSGHHTCVFGFTHDCEEFDMHPGELFVMMDKIPAIAERYLFQEFGLPVRIDIEMGATSGTEIHFERPDGGATFFDDQGRLVARMSGPTASIEAVLARLDRHYAVTRGAAEVKIKTASWNDLFSSRGCYYSGMGQPIEHTSLPITIARP